VGPGVRVLLYFGVLPLSRASGECVSVAIYPGVRFFEGSGLVGQPDAKLFCY